MRSTLPWVGFGGPLSGVRGIVLATTVVLLVWLAYFVFLVKPTNERDWEYGMATLPAITLGGSSIEVKHLRDFSWPVDAPPSANYIDRTFDVDRLERAWFVVEPFKIPPFYDFNGVAHTYFVFDFEDQPPVAISVESRRARGQGYDAVRGVFKQYELIYIWGTEPDVTGRRAVIEHNPLYMYPLSIPIESERALFVRLAQVSHELESEPRFYNSLTSNCTNELAKVANMVKPGAIPLNIALVLPGYADQLLYELGFIPRDVPLDELRQRSFITDTVIANAGRQDLSAQLRAALASR